MYILFFGDSLHYSRSPNQEKKATVKPKCRTGFVEFCAVGSGTGKCLGEILEDAPVLLSWFFKDRQFQVSLRRSSFFLVLVT